LSDGLRTGIVPADEGTESLLVGTVTDTDEGIGVLRGWKDIAKYLRTSERTATRWSIEKGLPVHRSGRGSLVVAYRSELDGWQREMAGTVGSLTDALAPVHSSRPLAERDISQRP
jgi:excisionase family DNA binding protein